MTSPPVVPAKAKATWRTKLVDKMFGKGVRTLSIAGYNPRTGLFTAVMQVHGTGEVVAYLTLTRDMLAVHAEAMNQILSGEMGWIDPETGETMKFIP